MAVVAVGLVAGASVPAGAIGGAYQLAGVVRDARGVPLAGVTAAVAGGPSTVTDNAGAYSLSRDLPGTYRLDVSRDDVVPAGRSVDTGLVPGTTVADFDVLYRQASGLSRSALSPSVSPLSVLSVTSWAGEPGVAGQPGKACVEVADSRTGSTEALSLVSDPPGVTSQWSWDLQVPSEASDGVFSLEVRTRDCGSGVVLAETNHVAYVVDGAAPVIANFHPLNGSNTIFSNQQVTFSATDGLSGIDASRTRIWVTDVDTGTMLVFSGPTLAQQMPNGELRTTSHTHPALTLNHTYRARAEVFDWAGNGAAMGHSDRGGFKYVTMTAKPGRAKIDPKPCSVGASSTPGFRSVTCTDVPVSFAAAPVELSGSNHGGDTGFAHHSVALTTAVFRAPSGEVWSAGLNGWADVEADLPFQLPADDAPAAVTAAGRTVTVAGLTGDVPATWTAAALEMGTVTPVDTTAAVGNACATPTEVAPGITCSSDPTLTRFQIALAGSTQGVADQAHALIDQLGGVVQVIHDDGIMRAADVALPDTALSNVAAVSPKPLEALRPIMADVAEAQAFRQRLAFDASEATVLGLLRGTIPSSPDKYYGPLTDAELTEIEFRQEGTSTDQAMVETYIASNALDGIFGGMYIDHQAGGKLAVRFTDNVELHRTALTAAAQHPERLLVIAARSSESELRRVATQIHDERADLLANGIDIRQARIDIFENQVAVSLCAIQAPASAPADTGQYLADRYPTVTVAPPSQTDCNPEQAEFALAYVGDARGVAHFNDDPNAPPYYGGVHIGKAGNYPNGPCSIGFAVTDPLGAQSSGGWGAGLLTARHCWRDEYHNLPEDPGPQAKHGPNDRNGCVKNCTVHTTWTVVGYSHDSGSGNTQSDSAFIDTDFAHTSDKIYTHYGTEWLRPVKGVAKMKDNPEGTPQSPGGLVEAGKILCMIGRTTGGHCGIITDKQHNNVNVEEFDPQPMVYDDMISVDLSRPTTDKYDPRPTLGGDSGGPVYASTGKGEARKIWIAGLVYGSEHCKDQDPSASVDTCPEKGMTLLVTKVVHDLKFQDDDGKIRTMHLRVAP